jgi:glycosyltransferase involved in cell wall biosynthesis
MLQYQWEHLLWAGLPTGNVAILEHGPIPKRLLGIPILKTRLLNALRAARHVFAVSLQARRSILSLAPERNVEMLYAGTDLAAAENARKQAESVRSRLGISKGALVLSFCGRVVRNKGIFDVIRLAGKNPALHLLVVGDGPDLAESQAMAANMDAADRITFVGHTAEPLLYVAASDCLALLSTDPGEGRPLSALEAWSLGTPILALKSSQALCDLAQEPSAPLCLVDDIEAVDSATLGSELKALSTASKPYRRNWDDVAEDLLSYLDETPVSPSRSQP